MQGLITYSLVKTLYDRGQDYLDAFWPFVLRALPLDRGFRSPAQISDLLESDFALRMPIQTVGTMAERAKRRGGYVKRYSGNYQLTSKGVEYVFALESEATVERRIQALVTEASRYVAQNHDLVAERTVVRKQITRVVKNNTRLFQFVVERQNDQGFETGGVWEEALLGYFSHVESEKPESFETLRDVILGSVIAGLLNRTEITDIDRGFDQTVFFADTNFVLSALGLRHPVRTRPAEELVQLVRESKNLEIRVFDFTLEEVFQLLRGYRNAVNRYPKDVPVNSIYASMRSRGIQPSDVVTLIANVDDRLGDLSITVEETGVHLGDLEDPDPDVLTRLRVYKEEQNFQGALHDLLAIATIEQMRGRRVRRFEQAGAFLLTEDVRLSKYAYIERGHRADETVSEVVPDRLLTNLLWLKHPNVLREIELGSVIALHSRDLFINRDVWDRFYDQTQALIQAGELDDGAAALLIYDAQLRRDLSLLGADRSTTVDRDWVLDRVSPAKERAEMARARELSLQAIELQREGEYAVSAVEVQMDAALEAAEQEREAKRQESRAALVQSVRDVAKTSGRTAGRIVLGLRTFLLFVLGLVLIYVGIPIVLGQVPAAADYLLVGGLIVALVTSYLGIQKDPFAWLAKFEIIVTRRLIDHRLKDFHPLLEEFEVRPSEIGQLST